MLRFLSSVADLWIGRNRDPSPEALAAVGGRAPAVVVTGASRGIGRALAMRFARAGRDVALVARDADALARVAAEIARAHGVKAMPIALDVTALDAPAALDAALRAAGLYADVLVNNAGIGLAGPFAENAPEEIDRLVALNVTALTRLTRHALPAMVARGRGGVLNVASLGGMAPGPHQAAYYASKAYVISLTEAVAYEARGRGVRIAVVAPGPVNTGFHEAMGAENALYRTLIPALSPEAVAASAYRGFCVGRTKIAPGVVATVSAVALKLLPAFVSAPLMGVLLARPERPR
ncbi:short-chain dehydrogenase [Hyphomicrobium nitrativorans NL23]|uniref:Short-chain dehydrogenase n=1 Tax=Hyphomicrobium nitrativorans NL23 TaxID=1029756 RepID=V5SA90_9HYPH|nr:SDR family NAD(P)-dependent oxidoreductase [Hyphomicrobium nitrativorans]AHB47337.1 short-chain dehydrogenase [Hyphomicrobium nitrativorans NL23]